MPQTYHDFDPWRKAAENIASGMVQVQQAKFREQARQQEMLQRQPVLDAQAANYTAGAERDRAAAGVDAEKARRLKFANDQVMDVMRRMEAGTKKLPNGRVELSEDAYKAAASLPVMLASDASDFGTAFKSVVQGANYTAEGDLNRQSREQMNSDRVQGKLDQEQVKGEFKINSSFNLASGAKRYDADGNLIAANDKPAPQAKTAQADVERLRAVREELRGVTADIRKLGDPSGFTEEQHNNYVNLFRQKKKLQAQLDNPKPGLSDNSQNSTQIPLTAPGVSGQGVVTPQATLPPDGAVVRHKTTGQTFVVKNGQLVPQQ